MFPLPLNIYLFRKFVHLALAALVFFAPSPAAVITFALTGGFLSLVLPFISVFRRFFYSGRDAGPFIYFLFLLLVFWFFPFPVASLAWLILAVGDATAPWATFMSLGVHFPHTRKTLSGFLIYTTTTFLATWLAAPRLSANPFPPVDLFFACLAAAVVDAHSRRPWDNLLPPLAAALVLALP